ncbi:MAG: DUF421 domain-containing protein [Clostridia bacterium]|nr:DUF421 domain-containing protein [Clostridia bacterium]
MGAIFIRALILYAVVLIAIRLMGKREVGQLQPFELVVTIMIADLASVPMQDIGIPLIQGIVPILALLVGQLVLSFLNLKSGLIRRLISGKPTVLIANGKIMEERLRSQKYTIDGLLEELRVAGYPDIRDVEYAVLEVSGEVSVIPKAHTTPVSKSDMNIPSNNVGFQIPLVIDGSFVDNNIQELGMKREDVGKILKENQAKLEEVFLLLRDETGEIYMQKKEARGGK